MRYDWEKLNRQQVGAFSEYFVKMEFTMYGFQVYTTEIDDRGIDFVTRFKDDSFLTIQVKSIRKSGYVFMEKSKYKISEDLFLGLVILNQGMEPNVFLIPSTTWNEPNKLFVDRNYVDKKSKPEYGLNLSLKNLNLLEEYSFEKSINKLILDTSLS